MSLDLLTATDHTSPYEWGAVFLAHAMIGIFLTSSIRWLIAFFRGIKNDDNGHEYIHYPSFWSCAIITAVIYFAFWEIVLQKIGAGWLDALIDTFAILIGGLCAAAIWARRMMALFGAGCLFSLAGAAMVAAKIIDIKERK